MRLLVASAHRRHHGGIETYLQRLLPGLAARGHAVGFLAEVEGDRSRPLIEIPTEVAFWCAEEVGAAASLENARDFRPDVIFCHCLQNVWLEERLLKMAPSVFFAHNYYGTCISGTKTRCLPHAEPCQRTFGPACLAQYFPRRCGGLNPGTMFRLYGENRSRLALLHRYSAVLANSKHLALEYQRHSIGARPVPLFAALPTSPVMSPPQSHYQLLFVGRMENLKGGEMLLAALPQVQGAVDRELRAGFIGEGSERAHWQRIAQQLAGGMRIEFSGWMQANELVQEYSRAHLLVMPSLWPEPFGLIGLEAGLCSLPAVAFPVGGIPEWLGDGENGVLASLPANAENLARAIVRALHPDLWPQLRVGAASVADKFSLQQHCSILEGEFERVVSHNCNIAAAAEAR